jgi:opacity protein-like surface antigen
MAAMAQSALAADLPDLSDLPILRGGLTEGLSTTSVNWQGAYVGGHAAYTSANQDFTNATSSLTSFMLQNISYQGTVSSWSLLGKASPTSTGFGGFVGYNAQWDDVILSAEANYTHMSGLTGSSSNALPSIVISGGCQSPPPGQTNVCGVALSGGSSATIKDTLTLRGRAGWAYENFLGYGFAGLALATADITRSATIVETNSFYDSTTNAFISSNSSTRTQSQTSRNQLAYGWTAGLGVEAMLWGGLFARAEYEYVKYTSVKNINMTTNTVRAGLGYKF